MTHHKILQLLTGYLDINYSWKSSIDNIDAVTIKMILKDDLKNYIYNWSQEQLKIWKINKSVWWLNFKLMLFHK